MKFGAYTAILHDRPLPEALTVLRELGLSAAEINVGGFLPPVHMPTIDDILTSDDARDEYLGTFAEAGVELAGLNANGNPLHPDPQIGPPTLSDIERAIAVANRLGQTRVVTMSGLPGADASAPKPTWVVNPLGVLTARHTRRTVGRSHPDLGRSRSARRRQWCEDRHRNASAQPRIQSRHTRASRREHRG
jgi:sugar phosphate isomerase/epimerase